jgi:dihydroflavonol-4-reductase
MTSGKNMTTYFITGGFGFMGQYMVKALHEHDPGAELRVLGRTKHATLLGVEKLEKVRWVQGDLLNPETFKHELQDVDVVVHNAALISFRRSDAEKVYQANVVGTRNLTQAALDAGCKNFIFISSISAVGSNPGGVADENNVPDLEYKRRHDMYGYSKYVSEMELRELTDHMRVIILNPSVVLGPGSDRIEAVLRMTRYLPIMPMLSYINSFVDARDVARAVVLALTEGRSGERYIVTAHHEDMLMFARTALKAAGRRTLLFRVTGAGVRSLDAILWILDLLKLNPGIRRPSEMAVDKVLSWEKIRREIGWEPAYTLEQSIIDSVKK